MTRCKILQKTVGCTAHNRTYSTQSNLKSNLTYARGGYEMMLDKWKELAKSVSSWLRHMQQPKCQCLCMVAHQSTVPIKLCHNYAQQMYHTSHILILCTSIILVFFDIHSNHGPVSYRVERCADFSLKNTHFILSVFSFPESHHQNLVTLFG